MILVIGAKDEVHANFMYKKLESINEDVAFFDTRRIPNNLTVSWNPSDKEFGRGYFKIEGKKILFSDIKSVYWRYHYGYSAAQIKTSGLANPNNITFIDFSNTGNNFNAKYMIQREVTSAFSSVFLGSDWLWCNPLSAIELHKRKSYQLNLMAQNGIRVPKSIITNNAEDVEKFIEENGNKVIIKPVLGGAYTKKITKDDLSKYDFAALENSPVQLQELIEGTDIRVYAIGNEIFPAEIRANTIDFRDDKEAKIIPVELPDNIKNDCLKILPLFYLNYSGIDIRKTPEGEYVFIEANPAPMFIHFEKQSKYPISDTLIKLLKRD